MSNQISKDKVRTQFVLTKKLVAQMDGRAASDGITRTDVVVAALNAYLNPVENPAVTKLDTIIAKIDTIEANQATNATMLRSAIADQPIAVQQLPAPASEPQEDWRDKSLWDRLLKR